MPNEVYERQITNDRWTRSCHVDKSCDAYQSITGMYMASSGTSGAVAEVPQRFSGSKDDLLQLVPILQVISKSSTKGKKLKIVFPFAQMPSFKIPVDLRIL